MRLLNTETLKLHYFVANVPEYAILSHTWGEGEVLFDDVDKPHVTSLAGYDKVMRCCKQAKRDGFQWAWVDTCCIDKTSSAELSEAINSMYQWYWNAGTCYAYLADVADHYESGLQRPNDYAHDFQKSRWFTRGWTLQELLAPTVVEFYTQGWRRLGSRTKLVDQLVSATNIGSQYLLDRHLIATASIATRFSWASLRQTTRTEDMAYCLLGLVDINMPMLYGEGAKAFNRLQLEVIKQSNDHTIFAWQFPESDAHPTTSAILASSPAAFKSSAQVRSMASQRPTAAMTYEMTNNGLKINLQCIAISYDRMVAIIDCQNEKGERLGIWLQRSDGDHFYRLPGSDLLPIKLRDVEDAEFLDFYVKAASRPVEKASSDPCFLKADEYRWSDLPRSKSVFSSSHWGGRDVLQLDWELEIKESDLVAIGMDLHYSEYEAHDSPTVTILLGMHDKRPTIRTVAGQIDSQELMNRASKLDRLIAENSKYVHDYYRASGCCGTVLEIELRKTCQDVSVCWNLDIHIKQSVSDAVMSFRSYAPSISCLKSMVVDGTIEDLELACTMK